MSGQVIGNTVICNTPLDKSVEDSQILAKLEFSSLADEARRFRLAPRMRQLTLSETHTIVWQWVVLAGGCRRSVWAGDRCGHVRGVDPGAAHDWHAAVGSALAAMQRRVYGCYHEVAVMRSVAIREEIRKETRSIGELTRTIRRTSADTRRRMRELMKSLSKYRVTRNNLRREQRRIEDQPAYSRELAVLCEELQRRRVRPLAW